MSLRVAAVILYNEPSPMDSVLTTDPELIVEVSVMEIDKENTGEKRVWFDITNIC